MATRQELYDEHDKKGKRAIGREKCQVTFRLIIACLMLTVATTIPIIAIWSYEKYFYFDIALSSWVQRSGAIVIILAAFSEMLIGKARDIAGLSSKPGFGPSLIRLVKEDSKHSIGVATFFTYSVLISGTFITAYGDILFVNLPVTTWYAGLPFSIVVSLWICIAIYIKRIPRPDYQKRS